MEYPICVVGTQSRKSSSLGVSEKVHAIILMITSMQGTTSIVGEHPVLICYDLYLNLNVLHWLVKGSVL